MSTIENFDKEVADSTAAEASSNSLRGVNMQMADKLSEKLKASSLGELLDDGDLRELIRVSIYRAFFAPERISVKNDYGSGFSTKEQPSLLLRETLNGFKSLIDDAVKAEVVKLWNDPDGAVQTKIKEMITPEVIQVIMLTALKSTVNSWVASATLNPLMAIDSRIMELARKVGM
jgi:hypothetical protein